MTKSLAHEIQFDSRGENIRLDLLFESQTPCTYEITSHDSRGMYQGTIMKGNNLNGPSDHFLIPTNITELDQRLIGWNIIFGASIDGTENKYSATMRFSQGNGNMLADKIHASGLHNSEKVIIGFARFIAQAEYTKGRLGAETSTSKQDSAPQIHS